MKPVILAALFIALPALARLGETQKELVARYGDPIRSKAWSSTFSKSEFIIQAEMLDGKCGFIYFHHERKLNPAQIAVLLAANKGASEWDDGQSLETGYTWTRKDKGAYAVLVEDMDGLLVMSSKWKEEEEAKKKAEAERKRAEMKGF